MNQNSTTVAIVGGGLAGLAAACALSDAGFRVTVFERRPFLGGRASSYQLPASGEVVDNCQHVLFGCCTNLIDFYRRIGVSDKIRWSDRMTFVEPGGRTSVLRPCSLPAPFHTAPSFLGFPFLSAADKLAIARALAVLIPHPLQDTGQPFLTWLEERGQTKTAIQRFWKPILVSALSDELELMSVFYAAMVVRESLKSASARTMGIPTVPLTELYRAAEEYLGAHGGDIQMRVAVDSFRAEGRQVTLSLGEREKTFDFAVIAVPFHALARLLPTSREAEPLRQCLEHFEASPITGIHFWFDREITDLDHAILLDRTIQWMFHKSRLLRGREPVAVAGSSAEQNRAGNHSQPAEVGVLDGEPRAAAAQTRELGIGNSASYVELVVSSSKSLLPKSRSQIIDLALAELKEFFPRAGQAALVKATVIKEVHATYSPQPGMDLYRPGTTTAWPRVFLAGDWTATGWPATMEGAVRSGYRAAEILSRAAGQDQRSYLVADLRPQGLMRLFGN